MQKSIVLSLFGAVCALVLCAGWCLLLLGQTAVLCLAMCVIGLVGLTLAICLRTPAAKKGKRKS